MSSMLVITGSPRKGGNSSRMADAFIESARGLGHAVERVDAASAKVAGCRACEQCFSKGEPCVVDDDFNAIAWKILDADAIVFAAPTYWYTFPAQLKCVLDRMFSFAVGAEWLAEHGKSIKGKKCALLACCEESDPSVMDGLTGPLARSAALIGWDSVGSVLVPGVYKAGDIEGTDALAKCAELAKKF